MRKLHFPLYLVLAVSVLFSCKKEDTDKGDTVEKAEFIVNGVADVTFSAGVGLMGLEVKHISGPQSTVNLSLSGLPSGVEAKFSSPSGAPTFNSTVTFTTTGQTGGTYPATLQADNGTTTKSYSFNLHLEQGDDCADDIVTDKPSSSIGSECLNGRGAYATLTKDPSVFGRIHISINEPFGSPVELTYKYSFYIDINCFTQQATIPQQSIGYGKEVSGTAEFFSFPIRLYLTYKDASGETDECMMIL